MVISDKTLYDLQKEKEIITPFEPKKVSRTDSASINKAIPSYGLSHCGYDCRLANEFKTPRQIHSPVSITTPDTDYLFVYETDIDEYIIPPKGFVLSRTIEYFKMPDDIMGSFFCKSTLARMGLMLPPTIIEPGWCGHLVVEIANMSSFPITLKAGVGIGQMIFFKLDTASSNPYNGKYQNQTGVTCGKM